MILKIFKKLDRVISDENSRRRINSSLPIPRFYIKLLGQMALFESKIELSLASTMDLDVYANYNSAAKKEFEMILNKFGFALDPTSNEIWMPEETEYEKIYNGMSFDGCVAKPEYVLISKAKMAKEKNRNLILQYISKFNSKIFNDLVIRYKIDIESFL